MQAVTIPTVNKGGIFFMLKRGHLIVQIMAVVAEVIFVMRMQRMKKNYEI